jgi:hypothetical protein
MPCQLLRFQDVSLLLWGLAKDPSVLGGVGGETGGMAGIKDKTFWLYLIEAPKAEGIVVCFYCIRM